VSITLAADPFSNSGTVLLDALHAIPAPTDAHSLFDGIAQESRDNVSGILRHLPRALVVAAVTTVVLLLLTDCDRSATGQRADLDVLCRILPVDGLRRIFAVRDRGGMAQFGNDPICQRRRGRVSGSVAQDD
jgi:hypothetical protein